MIEINSELEPESASGVLKGYAGKFKSYGVVDLAKRIKSANRARTSARRY